MFTKVCKLKNVGKRWPGRGDKTVDSCCGGDVFYFSP